MCLHRGGRGGNRFGKGYPNLTVRCFKDSPEWLYELVAETVRMGIGNPMVVNDEVYVPNLVKLGYPLEDARDYYNMGCVENMIMGRTPIWLGVNQTDFAGLISRTLSGGRLGDSKAYTYLAPLSDDKLLVDLDTLDTFDKFLAAYEDQMRFSLRDTKEKCDLQDQRLFSTWCDPFGTLVMEGCLEKGKDMYKGGCKIHAAPARKTWDGRLRKTRVFVRNAEGACFELWLKAGQYQSGKP